MDPRRKRLALILVCLAVFGAVAGLVAWRLDLLSQVGRCLEWVRNEGAGVFFVAMALLPFVGIPLSPFVLSAGALFAPSLGAGVVILCGVAAMAFNIAVSYWFAAYALRPSMERLILWMGYRVPKLPGGGKGVELTLLLRLVPGVPFFMQNYLLGVARVHFGLYMLISVLVPTVHLTIAVLAGDALMQGNHGKLMVAGALFAVVGVGLHLLRKRLAAKRAVTRSLAGTEKIVQTEA